MVDVALIVIACIVPCLLLVFNLVVLARYLDPSATSGHWIAKAMIVLGLLLAECTILLLPLDVGNRSGVVGCGFWNNDCGGLNLAVVWQIVYVIIFALVVVVFPFFIYFYENDDEGMSAEEESGGSKVAAMVNFGNFKRSLCVALCYTLVTCAIAALVLGVSYIYLSKSYVPYQLTSVDPSVFQPVGTPISAGACAGGATCIAPCGTGSCSWSADTLKIDVTFVIYLAALLSWVGWFIFSIYVGIGFVALPLDCFNAFIHRPKVLSYSEAKVQKRTLRSRAEELIKVGEGLASGMIEFSDEMRSKRERRKRSKVDSVELNRFRVLVDMLEQDLEQFQLCDPAEYRNHYNPFVPYAKLVGGIISVIVSGVWIIHIIIYQLFSPPLYAFLNVYFAWFDTWFPLFGTISVGVFGLYLLLAVAKGNTKFGTRFFLIKVHPMEVRRTLMNSFVFNIALILLCVLPATQFMTDAFSQYARLTDAGMIFSTQFRYMEFFRYFWQYNVFLFMILIFFFLSVIYFAIFPSDRSHLQRVMQQIKAKNQTKIRNLDRKITQQGGALQGIQLADYR